MLEAAVPEPVEPLEPLPPVEAADVAEADEAVPVALAESPDAVFDSPLSFWPFAAAPAPLEPPRKSVTYQPEPFN